MGWLGVLFIVSGNIRLARQHLDAFVLIIAGNICWLANGILTQRLDIIAYAILALVIHSRNYLHWKKLK